MWKYSLLFSAIAFRAFDAFGGSDKMIAQGHWYLERTEQCEDSDKYEHRVELRKNKINRTHEVFNGFLDFKEDFTEDGFGMYMDAFKKVDGGYKLTQVFEEESFLRFAKRFLGENVKDLLINMGLESQPPIPMGHHEITGYRFNYDEMPKQGMVGTFKGVFYAVKEKERVACIIVHASFTENEEEDDDE